MLSLSCFSGQVKALDKLDILDNIGPHSCMCRLVCVEVTKDSSTCLACLYLNEYKVAVAAFTLHASENKLVRVSGLFTLTWRLL